MLFTEHVEDATMDILEAPARQRSSSDDVKKCSSSIKEVDTVVVTHSSSNSSDCIGIVSSRHCLKDWPVFSQELFPSKGYKKELKKQFFFLYRLARLFSFTYSLINAA